MYYDLNKVERLFEKKASIQNNIYLEERVCYCCKILNKADLIREREMNVCFN